MESAKPQRGAFCVRRSNWPRWLRIRGNRMHWIAPSGKDSATDTLEKRLWDAADQFRANSGLKPQEYSAAGPRPHLPALRRSPLQQPSARSLEKAGASSRRGHGWTNPPPTTPRASSTSPPNARFDYLLNLPEAADIGAKVNEAMRDIEKHNPQLAGVLPKTYNLFTSTLLKELLKKVSEIPASARLRRLRAHLRILPRRVRHDRRPGRRRVLHARQHRPAAHGSHRAVSRAHPRSRVRFGRHVRLSRRGSCPSTRRTPPRNFHPRRREDRRNRTPLPHEPRRPWAGRRHPARRQRQQLLRRPARRHRSASISSSPIRRSTSTPWTRSG